MKNRRREGFPDQKLTVLTKELRVSLQQDSLCRQLYFTDIGIFPKAENHYVMRPRGTQEFVIIFCFGGRGWCEYAGHREMISQGQYFILPPDKKHAYGSEDGYFWKKGWIHFKGEVAPEVAGRLNSFGYGRAHEFELHKEWFDRFNTMIDGLSYDSTFENVAYNCSRLWPSLAQLVFPRRRKEKSGSHMAIDKSLEYIQQNVKEIISLDELATVAGLSVSRFCVLFKEKNGQSAKDYHTQLKIQQACRMLSMTDWTVKEIARDLGFADPYYFSRCFKLKMGLSPQHYREQKFY